MTKSWRKQAFGRNVARLFVFIQGRFERKSQAKRDKFGTRIGHLVFAYYGKRRDRAIANVQLAFPDKTPEECRAIAKASAGHFGRVLVDFLGGAKRTDDQVRDSVRVSGRENLDSAIAQGKGALLLTGHFGNWERANAWLGVEGYKMNVLVRTADDVGVDKIVNDIRRSRGANVIPRGDAVKPLIGALSRGEIIGLLIDQNGQDAFLPFFGHPAGTAMGAGIIQARAKCPVVPFVCVDVGTDAFELTFYPPLQWDETGTRGEGMMLAYHHWLEDRIREHPEQWLWMHDRWRHARRNGLL